MKFKGSKQAGFSLVELMVVVGIIGILAALAVPRLQVFTAKAKVSEGRALVSNLGTLLNAYYAENSVYSPGQLGAAGAVTPVTVMPDGTVNAAVNLQLSGIGFNRVVTNQMFYGNPGFVAGLVGGNNQFTAWAVTRLGLCSGVNAADMRVAPQVNQNNQIGFAAVLAAPAPVVGGAGVVPAASAPQFNCN